SGYLGLYAIYIITVIVGYRLHKRKRKHQRENSLKKTFNNVVSRRGSVHPVAPDITIISAAIERIKAEDTFKEDTFDTSNFEESAKRKSVTINGDTLAIFPISAVALASTIVEEGG
ncbi:hypothetical protein OSTOST_12886, partial [Ostertagia ostertagi]